MGAVLSELLQINIINTIELSRRVKMAAFVAAIQLLVWKLQKLQTKPKKNNNDNNNFNEK